MSKNNFAFNVNLYGKLEQATQTLSKARVRIFYRGLNRNYTYITDEFADKLVSSLPYTPIVGKYTDGDFSNHGDPGEQLQVYGVVPEQPNFEWETHVDEDGEERVYACADVLLWTARFNEAKTICDKSQSMELYDKSIKGKWVYQNGKRFFKFTDGCFLGLTALGDNTEPCFEGAAFYSYEKKSLNELIAEVQKYNMNGGKEKMALQFKLSDREKHEAIFNLINPNLQDGILESTVCEVYDEYALCYNYEGNEYFRAYYSKNADDVVEINRKEKAYVMDVSEVEYQVLQRLQALSGNNFSKIEEDVLAYQATQQADPEPTDPVDPEPTNEPDDKDSKDPEADPEPTDPVDSEPTEPTEPAPVEPENDPTSAEPEPMDPAPQVDNTEFSQQIDALSAQIAELNSQIDTLKRENENYSKDLKGYEAKAKEEIVKKYKKILAEDIIAEYTDKLDEYSIEELDKELAVQTVNNYSFNSQDNSFIPNGSFNAENANLTPAEKMLAKHLKKNN